MSIYATLWTLKFPKSDDPFEEEWIKIHAQGVPAHIGSPALGCGYEEGDPYEMFLPPPLETDENAEHKYMRAVVIVTENSRKGTVRSAQEYCDPLLILNGEVYATLPFDTLYKHICQALWSR